MPKFTGLPRVPIRGPKAVAMLGPLPNILRFYADPVSRLLSLAREGDIVAVNDGDPGLICAFGAEHNRNVITNAAIFEHDNDFPFTPPAGSALEQIKVSLVFMNGDQHRRQRRLMQPAFSKASIDAYANDILAIASTELDRWPIGSTEDIVTLLRRLTVSVVLRCLFGVEPGARADALGRVMTRMADVVSSPAVIALPFRIPGTPFNELSKLAEAFVSELKKLMNEKREQGEGQRDALALLLAARDEDGSKLTDEELVGQMTMLFFAGFDTSTQTLAWTLFLLSYYPKLSGELVDEIDALHGDPIMADVRKLVLVDRVVKESMRILPATPLLFTRVAAKEVKLGEFMLPKGSNVVLSPLITHRDPAVYPEPARFDPKRWETIDPSPYEYMPFGAGTRMCLGAGFATLAIRLMLPMILRRYRLSLPPGSKISCKVGGIVLGPKPGLPMSIARQDRAFKSAPRVVGSVNDVVDLPS